MSHSTTDFAAQYIATLATMCQACTKQRRTGLRLLLLTLGLALVAGRSMVSRMVVVLGRADRDWGCWYRLFSTHRLDLDTMRRQLVAAWLEVAASAGPLVVVVDSTQLPRTGRKMPGTGFLRNPRTPPWHPGIHHAQRWEGVSGLTAPTPSGDCRAIPLWFEPAAPATARPWPDHAPRKEWEAARDGIHWVHAHLHLLGAGTRPLVVVGDGAYSTAPLWRSLPDGITLIARCAKNRALFQVPPPHQGRGRRRLYGDKMPSPQQQLATTVRWQSLTVHVRGKDRHINVRCTGPYLVKPAPGCPLMLITVAGISRTVGHHTRSRDAMHYLVNAHRDAEGRWTLPFALQDLIHWLWQRWEVEVMHRELKSGWGLGDQQQWSARGAVMVTAWVVWAYGVMLAVGSRHEPDIVRGPVRKWYRGRRWTPRDLTMLLRQAIWTSDPVHFRGDGAQFGANPPEIAALRALLATSDAL